MTYTEQIQESMLKELRNQQIAEIAKAVIRVLADNDLCLQDVDEVFATAKYLINQQKITN